MFALKTQSNFESAGAEELVKKLRKSAGAEEEPLPLAEAVQFLLMNTDPQTAVELPAPYNRRIRMSELPFAVKVEETLEAVMREANVDGLSLVLVPGTNTVRVEPPPTDPDRPRWSWPVAQALARYEELTVENQPLREAVGDFPRPDKVRELLSARPIPAAQVKAALQRLRAEADVAFFTLSAPEKFTEQYYGWPETVDQLLAEAIEAVPSPMENVRQAGLDLLQAALDYNARLEVLGFEGGARSPGGTLLLPLNARRLLQDNRELVLLELEQEGIAPLLRLQGRQPQDTDGRLEIAALILETRLKQLLGGRPRALVSLTDRPLEDLLEALRERKNWESLEIVHEDNPNPAFPLASIAVTQGDAERQFRLSFEERGALFSPEVLGGFLVFDLSVFQRPDNRAHGKIVLRRPSPAAGVEEQERAGGEFISRYLAILPANSGGAARQEAIQRLAEASAEVSLAGRIEEDPASGFVRLGLPTQLPDLPFEGSRRLRPPQVLYDRAAGELYTYTEWGSGKDRKSGLTPVFTRRRLLELTAKEGGPGTISSERIRNGEIVLLAPKAISSAAAEEGQAVQEARADLTAAGIMRAEAERTGDAGMVSVAEGLAQDAERRLNRWTSAPPGDVGESQEILEARAHVIFTRSALENAQKAAPSPDLSVLSELQGKLFSAQGRLASLLSGQGTRPAEDSAAGAEEPFEAVVEGVERVFMSDGPVELEAVRLRLRQPLDREIGPLAGLYPDSDSAPPLLTAFRRAAGPQDLPLPFFALASPAAVLALEPAETQEQTNLLNAGALERAVLGNLPAGLSGRRVILARYRNLRVEIQSPKGLSAGMPLKLSFRPQVVLPQRSPDEVSGGAGSRTAQANPFKLIFRPENAGLSLLLGRQGVEARIVVGSEQQEKILLELRPDFALTGSIVPGYKFASIDLAVEVARLALGPGATEVRQILAPRNRAVLRGQIEAWLHPFPWKSPVTLEDALLNNIVNLLGA